MARFIASVISCNFRLGLDIRIRVGRLWCAHAQRDVFKSCRCVSTDISSLQYKDLTLDLTQNPNNENKKRKKVNRPQTPPPPKKVWKSRPFVIHSLNFWRRNYFFFNFSTPCIWNVNNTGTKQVSIMKQTAFWREKTGEYRACLKYSVPIFVE